MGWSESEDEALCFGWIDGIRRRIDEHTYSIRFTPRKPSSIWSAVNIAKVEQLQAAGRMTPAGLAAFAHRKAHKSAVYSHELAAVVELPASLQRAFQRNKAAWRFFQESTPPSYRKSMLHWVAELPGLLNSLLRDSAAKLGRSVPQVDPSVLTALAGHDWPGNIRELASVLERAMLLAGATRLGHHLGLPRRSVASSPPPSSSRPSARFEDPPTSNPGLRLADEVNEIERRRVIEALDRCAGNQVRAAEQLSISRRR